MVVNELSLRASDCFTGSITPDADVEDAKFVVVPYDIDVDGTLAANPFPTNEAAVSK